MPLPLLLLDLDNTLVDRDAAFRAAVVDFLGEYGLAAADAGWVMELDGGGYVARGEVAAAMADRYGDVVPVAAVRALLDGGGADRVVLAEDARDALVKARAGAGVVASSPTAVPPSRWRRFGPVGSTGLFRGGSFPRPSVARSRIRRSFGRPPTPSVFPWRGRGSSVTHPMPTSRVPTSSGCGAYGSRVGGPGPRRATGPPMSPSTSRPRSTASSGPPESAQPRLPRGSCLTAFKVTNFALLATSWLLPNRRRSLTW